MNSRKNLSAFTLAFFFILGGTESMAQNSFGYSNGTFSVSLAPINPTQAPPAAYYKVFLETGNGRYTRSGQINDGSTIPPYNYQYPYQIGNNSQAVVTISSYYDTTPRPPRQTALAVSNTGSPDPLPQVNLPSITGKPQSRIGIDPCVDLVVPGDTMAVALIYKPYTNPGSTTLVAFFYNNPLEGGNIFSPVDEATSYTFNNPVSTKAIRRFNNEPIYTSLPSGIPGEIASYFSNADNGYTNYTNALYFLIPAAASDAERNIFLSLAPTKNTSSYNKNASTGFTAVIIPYNGSGLLAPPAKTYAPLGIRMLARDPNGITTNPHCFIGSEGIVDGHNTLISNTIRIENEGPGTAKHVSVAVTIPEGITIPSLITNAYVSINGSTKQFKLFGQGVKYSYMVSGRTITFIMQDVGLKGRLRTKFPEERKARIWFSLRTNATGPIPECLYTDISIVFTNEDNSRNKPIKAFDLVRTNCSSTNPCPRSSKAGGPITQ
ncbi:MAG TPA: hypothetical protein PLZ45_12375 [Ferruginibacter sp.]|nr:hypothetical protein [Chitinophagaceae bacterium]HRI25465.1 hypothetical protein [Ferruginibacter sp.]